MCIADKYTQAAIASFLSYYLVKVVPYWGLAVLATTVVFFAPLVYTTNQELIDHHVKQASDIVNSQTEQLRQVAGQHASQATELTKQYMGDYTAKAQEMLRGRSASHEVPMEQVKPEPVPVPVKEPAVKESDFPVAPKEALKADNGPLPEIDSGANLEEEPSIAKLEEEPLIAA